MDEVRQLNVDEIMVENVISQFALRQIHVIRQGVPVDPARWVDMVPEDAADRMKLFRFHEEDLDVHHLFVVWNARELVDLSRTGAPLRYAVVWFIADGETASWAIELAACTYQRMFKRWPTVAWLQKVLSHYPKELQLDCGEMIQVEQADWVPQERYACVGIPTSEFDPTVEVDMSYREVNHG